MNDPRKTVPGYSFMYRMEGEKWCIYDQFDAHIANATSEDNARMIIRKLDLGTPEYDQLNRMIAERDDAGDALRIEQSAHRQTLVEVTTLQNERDEAVRLSHQYRNERDRVGDGRNELAIQLTQARREHDTLQNQYRTLLEQHGNQSQTIKALIAERDGLRAHAEGVTVAARWQEGEAAKWKQAAHERCAERDASRKDFQKLWEENKQLGAERDRLINWKGEIDQRRIALRLPFPSDYGNSPRYAISSLVRAEYAQLDAERAALVKRCDELAAENVKIASEMQTMRSQMFTHGEMGDRFIILMNQRDDANKAKRKVAQERDRYKNELESKNRVTAALHDELRQWRSGILQRPAHPLGGVSLHGVALKEVIDRETESLRNNYQQVMDAKNRELVRAQENLRIKSLERDQINEAYENLRQQSADTAAGIEVKRLRGRVAQLEADRVGLGARLNEAVQTIATIRDLVGEGE